MQINELKAEVAKFATIRDTLAYSADVLRDVTARQKCGAGHLSTTAESSVPAMYGWQCFVCRFHPRGSVVACGRYANLAAEQGTGGANGKGGSHGSTLERIEGELSSTAGHLAGAASDLSACRGCGWSLLVFSVHRYALCTVEPDLWSCAACSSVREEHWAESHCRAKAVQREILTCH